MQIVEEARYVYVDVSRNNNQFWNIALRDDHSAVTEWGRVGEAGNRKEFTIGDAQRARLFFESKRREKTAKGYVPLRTIGSTEANRSARLTEIAVKQLDADCLETQRLILRLARANVHNILAQTTMQYDVDSGAFSTPLGIVTSDALFEARALLSELCNLVMANRFDDPSFPGLLSQYLMLIPRDIGRARSDPRKLLPDLAAIQAQNALLDNLHASLDSCTARKPDSRPDDEPILFQAKLRLVSDPRITRDISKRYERTAQDIHASSGLTVARVFEVTIDGMRSAFEARSRRIGNLRSLWHGTRIGNLLSILKGGIVVPPANSPHVTGRMFGNGVYFSDQSTKALNYAAGYWSGTRESECYMLLCDVALGRTYTPRSWQEGFPHPNSDSTFARARISGVLNNEMVVYDPCQVNPRYLVEFCRKDG
jgi:poly [ADP-ribose] polymerase